MSRIKLATLAVPLVLCFLLSGCTKTWSVTFKDQGDIEDWRILHETNENDYYSITEEGLILDGYKAIAPFAFFGDCTMTVKFQLECDSSDPEYMCVIEFSDENDIPNDSLVFEMVNLGMPSLEKYWVMDRSGIHHASLADGGPVPNLDRSGENVVQIIREGSNLAVKLNGDQIFSGTFSNYSLDYVVPRLISYKVNGSDAVVFFKSIRVDYQGERLEL